MRNARYVNQVHLRGHLDGDPEITQTDGRLVASFSVRIESQHETWDEKKGRGSRTYIEIFPCSAFDTAADSAALFSAGQHVDCFGRIRFSSYQRAVGNTEILFEVVISRMVLVSALVCATCGEKFIPSFPGQTYCRMRCNTFQPLKRGPGVEA